MLDIIEYKKETDDLLRKANSLFEKAGVSEIHPKEEDTVTIAFAGQYSAGKSTIIKMLTGNDDIETGAGITTQHTDEYDWHGIKIIDTPGIGTGIREDHDAISYAAFSRADLLVYVVTYALFDSGLADDFRRLAIDKEKADEMILVVNKMSDSDEGNTLGQQSVLKEDLRKVLDPYTPEQLRITFLDAKSYLKGKSLEKDNPQRAAKLIKQSGYDSFVKTLDQFAEDKGLNAKWTTLLYEISQKLEDVLKVSEPKSDDDDINALEENYRQQRHVLSEHKQDLTSSLRNLFDQGTYKIRNLGQQAANLIVDNADEQEVRDQLEELIDKANKIIAETQDEAYAMLEKQLNETHESIEEVEQTPAAQMMKINLSKKSDSLPEGVQKLLSSATEGTGKLKDVIVKNAYNAESTGGLQLSNFSGSTVHDIVLKAGHMLGHSFKPWEAIKWTRGIAAGSQVLAAVGVGVSIFSQMKTDHDEDELQKELRKNRENVRSHFNSAADDLNDYGKKFIDSNVGVTLDKHISEIDASLKELRGLRKNKSDFCRSVEQTKDQCEKLIRKIHVATRNEG